MFAQRFGDSVSFVQPLYGRTRRLAYSGAF